MINQLKRARPQMLRVHISGRDTPEMLRIQATKRDRWARAVETINHLHWTQVDMLATDGTLIGIIGRDDDMTDPAEGVEPQASGRVGTPDEIEYEPEERLIRIVLEAQRLALDNVATMFKPMIDGYTKLADAAVARVGALEKATDKAVQKSYESASLKAEVDRLTLALNEGPGRNDDVMQIAGDVLALAMKRLESGERKSATKEDDNEGADE